VDNRPLKVSSAGRPVAFHDTPLGGVPGHPQSVLRSSTAHIEIKRKDHGPIQHEG